MRRVKIVTAAAVVAVMTLLGGSAAAQETNVQERTFLTFSGAVELPKLTLQPGTYVFKLADTPSRNVVQVWNQDEKEMLGQWLFVQAERPEVTGENVVMFRETAAGTTPAVQYWYFPGENVVMFRETAAGTTPAVQYWYFPGEKIGKEFIYPKDQAAQIAARAGTRVLTSEG